MSLTVLEAQQAGELARRIQSLDITIASLNEAIRGGATMTQIVASTTHGVYQTDWQMNAKSTAVALEMMKTVYDLNLADLREQLAAIGADK